MSTTSTATEQNEVTYDSRQVGRQIRPLFFTTFVGRGLRDIVDPLGRTYLPHVYDVPQWRFRVLRFCVEFIIMMMDRGDIRHDAGNPQDNLLHNKEEARSLRDMMGNIRNMLIFHDHSRKENGVPWDPGITLLDVETIRDTGISHDSEALMERTLHGFRYFDTEGLELLEGNHLIAVVTVRAMVPSNDLGADGTTWTLAFDATEGIGEELLHQELGSGCYDVELFEVPKAVVNAPETRAANQSPQFITLDHT